MKPAASKVLERCPWPGEDPLYRAYHDEEWGVPEYDDRALYAFEGFEPERIARFGKRETARLMADAGIIRSRAKIAAAITGAQLWLDIMEKEPGGFSQLIWKHVDGKPKLNRFHSMKDLPAKTEMSEKLAKDLKQRGFKFCGPVIVYAFAQAIGMVNDHIVSCHRYAACKALAAQPRPR